MSTQSETVRDAARLIAFALQPRLAAGSNEDYARLCAEYRVAAEFRETVDAVATGLDLQILAITDYGLIVAPEAESVFEFRLGDYSKRGWDTQARLLTGLAHVGIAAACYPREDDLESDIAVRRTLVQVDSVITETCERQREQAVDRAADLNADDLNTWELWLETPQTRRTKQDRYAADCRLGIIQAAFSWLEEQGFVKRTPTDGSFQVNDRYRIQIRDLAGSEMLDALRETAASGHDRSEVLS